MEKTYKIGVMGLRMGFAWSMAAVENPHSELALVWDPNWTRNNLINKDFFKKNNIPLASDEQELYDADLDIIIVASPDHFHADQCTAALYAGKHVICEKPLAPTVAECKQIISAVKETGHKFMTGQVCRFTPGFVTAKHLIESGQIGEIVFIESEYAHDYTKARGFDNWRCDPAIKREGFIGGGCHALDLVRWLAGDPEEVFCYTNRLHIPDWPTDDTGISVFKLPGGAIGKVFVSVGVKRPYTMRTVINGTKGTIICDNKSDHILIHRSELVKPSGVEDFAKIPVLISNHNVNAELTEFITCLQNDLPIPTDVIQGTRTVAFGEAALQSAQTGMPVKTNFDF